MTATQTPLVYPYNLIIEAYNEAGEKIKIIGQASINRAVTDFDTLTGNTKTDTFNAAEVDLTLRFPGIWTGSETEVPYVDFDWDGTNANGQPASQGIYYIKVIVTDEYGHTNAIVKQVQLLRTEEYVRLSIYNSSGELVRVIEQANVPGTQINLEVDDVFYINGGTSNSTTIKLGDAGVMQWDGKNSLGSLVSSGMYEVSVEVKDISGYSVISTKTITVLNESSGPIMTDVKFYPNPIVADQDLGAVMRICWLGTATGDVTVRVYNIAGELVTKIGARIEDLFVNWNMTANNGESLAPGFYAAVVEADTAQGERERFVIKLAVIRK
jgi:flagellar hook assembly protein FlgD